MSDRAAREVLDAWRELERRLAEVEPLSDDYDALEAEIATLRAEYQRVTAAHPDDSSGEAPAGQGGRRVPA